MTVSHFLLKACGESDVPYSRLAYVEIHTVTAETFSCWSDRVLIDSGDESEIAFYKSISHYCLETFFMTEKKTRRKCERVQEISGLKKTQKIWKKNEKTEKKLEQS